MDDMNLGNVKEVKRVLLQMQEKKRCSEAELVLEMYNKGSEPGHIAYTALIGGFARQGGEAFWV
uniref:Pentacotripeptide-repeat region of PRORP domain-containing protein n=1 Tax=Salix viminalis TaxID=40686 RepID=A0A6N2KZK7_SALVM